MDHTETAARGPRSGADRIRALRERMKQQGMAEVRGIFAHADDHAAIKAFAAKLARRRELAAKRAARQAAAGKA